MTENRINKHQKMYKLVGGIILAMFSILAQYDLPLMSYGLVFIFIYCMYLFFCKGKAAYINKSMLYFICYSLMQQLAVYLLSGTFMKNRNTYLFMFFSLFILIFSSHIDEKIFFKFYYIMGLICSLLVIYQFIMANLFGIIQSAIQILPVTDENQHFGIKNSNRVSGLFTEPQGYCSYILPLLAYLIFSHKFKSALLISIAIFASSSSQGIILMVIVWGYYFVIYGRNTVNKYRKCIAAGFIALLALCILIRIEQFSFIFEKIKSINIFAYDIRLTKGFQIYFAMPWVDKIKGIGFGNLTEYLKNGNFNFFWMPLTREVLFGYITTMSQVLVSFGFFGFFLYLNVFRKNRESKRELAKLILLLIFISSFTQTILFNAWYLFYWIVFEVCDNKDNSRYMIVKFWICNRR